MTREAIAALTQDDLLEIINQRADDILIWVHHTRYLAGVADACLNGGAVQVNIED